MGLPVARIGDGFTDQDTIAEGSGNVFVNNLPIARMTGLTSGHTLPGHTFYPPVPIIEGSGQVFANNLPIAIMNSAHAVHCDIPHDQSDCHDGIINTGSGNVFSG